MKKIKTLLCSIILIILQIFTACSKDANENDKSSENTDKITTTSNPTENITTTTNITTEPELTIRMRTGSMATKPNISSSAAIVITANDGTKITTRKKYTDEEQKEILAAFDVFKAIADDINVNVDGGGELITEVEALFGTVDTEYFEQYFNYTNSDKLQKIEKIVRFWVTFTGNYTDMSSEFKDYYNVYKIDGVWQYGISD
ncbi:hypothetical protein FACS1894132_12010 [Clostridia bacterium]|nr:hypothetical protein FACS1894132_12010 [Clostridia bacterium]